jgi:hypothetical protein
MITRRESLFLLLGTLAQAQTSQEPPVEYVCPMHPDVRSSKPGKCPRCGMELRANLPAYQEYPMEVQVDPPVIRPGHVVTLTFRVLDPKLGTQVRDFEIVHEKLIHFFVVSEDLQFFVHEHPEHLPDGSFVWRGVLPKPGLYRLLCDYFPSNGTPQLTVKSLIVPGQTRPAIPLVADMSEKLGKNTRVSVLTDPATPLEGKNVRMVFKLDPSSGLEQYLGVWAHMLIASGDLVDMIHEHPWNVQSVPLLDFKLIFPRHGIYRVWLQFQRDGVLNTVAFTPRIAEL